MGTRLYADSEACRELWESVFNPFGKQWIDDYKGQIPKVPKNKKEDLPPGIRELQEWRLNWLKLDPPQHYKDSSVVRQWRHWKLKTYVVFMSESCKEKASVAPATWVFPMMPIVIPVHNGLVGIFSGTGFVTDPIGRHGAPFRASRSSAVIGHAEGNLSNRSSVASRICTRDNVGMSSSW